MTSVQHSFALDLSGEGIALFLRPPKAAWEEAARIPVQLSSLSSDMAALRKLASDCGCAGGEVTVWLPFDQVRLAAPDQTVPKDHASDTAPRREIEMAEGAPAPALPKAIIPRATLAETDAFLREHGFAPLRYSTRYPLAETGTHPVFAYATPRKLPLVPFAAAAAVVLGLGLGGMGVWTYISSIDAPPEHQAFSPDLGWYEGAQTADLTASAGDMPHDVAVTQFLAPPRATPAQTFTPPSAPPTTAPALTTVAALPPQDLGPAAPSEVAITTLGSAEWRIWAPSDLTTEQARPDLWTGGVALSAPARLNAPVASQMPNVAAPLALPWLAEVTTATLPGSADPLFMRLSSNQTARLAELPLRWDWTPGTAFASLDQDPVGRDVQLDLLDESPRIWSLLARAQPYSGSEIPQITMSEPDLRARGAPVRLRSDTLLVQPLSDSLGGQDLYALTEIAQARFDAIARAEAAQPLTVRLGDTLNALPQISLGGSGPLRADSAPPKTLFAPPTAARVRVAAVNPTGLLDPFEFLPREARPVRVISQTPDIRPVPRPEGLAAPQVDPADEPQETPTVRRSLPRTPPDALINPSAEPGLDQVSRDALRPEAEPTFPDTSPPTAPLELDLSATEDEITVADRIQTLSQPTPSPFLGLLPGNPPAP
ncbi:MAG: hypothetical protein AAFR93_12190, partial [Pseudomonadota bacterium]